jgi:hypothetical protein
VGGKENSELRNFPYTAHGSRIGFSFPKGTAGKFDNRFTFKPFTAILLVASTAKNRGIFQSNPLNVFVNIEYSSPSIIRIIKSRRVRWAGNVARMGEKRNAYRLLVGKPEGTRPLGRLRHRVDNNKMDLGEVGWGDVRPLDSFPAFYGTRRFNTEFTRALHLFLS